MIIKNVEVIPFKIINKREVIWAAGSLPAAEHLIVKITAEDGTYGVSEAIPRPMIYGETQEGMYYALAKYLAPMIIGEDSFNLQRIWEKFETMPWNLAAKGAIDVALYDLNARLLNVPVYQLLGGPYRTKVPISWQIGFGTNEEMLDELKQKTTEGYRTFKVKGGPHPDNDIKLLKLMRKNSPDDVRLYIDANMAYGREDALRVMKALEGVLASMEEPLISWDNEGRKDLADRVSTPILSDESTFTVADVYHQIQLGALKQIGIKIPRTGFTLSTKIVHLAEIANMPVQISLQAECDFGTAACVQFACTYKQICLPCEVSYYVDNMGDTLLQKPLVIENGYMHLPEGPGMGVELDWEKVKKYAIKI
jgi:L-alanine-DL-glutamate epimerase-like enolase superfamily enzyme